MPPKKSKGKGKVQKRAKHDSDSEGDTEEPVASQHENALLQDVPAQNDAQPIRQVQELVFQDAEDGDGEDDGDLPPKAKRAKVSENISAQQEQILVDWFSENPLFFDQSLKDFKNKGKRDRLLEEKAKELDMSGSDIWLWFKSQRTIYGRLKKKKSGQATQIMTARQKWVMGAFSFLDSHLSIRTESRQLGNVVLPETVDDDDNDSDEAVSQRSQSPVPTQSSIQPLSSQAQSSTAQPSEYARKPPRPKDKSSATKTAKKVDQAIVTIAERMTSTQSLQENLEEVMKDAKSPRTAWAHWIGTEIQDFPDDLWCGFQQESFDLLMRYKDQVRSGTNQFMQPRQFQHPQSTRASSALGIPQRPCQQQWPGPQTTGFQNLSQSSIRGINTASFSGLPSGASYLSTPEAPTTEYNTDHMIINATQVLQGDDDY